MQRQHVAMKAETVHMQNIRGKAAQQFDERAIVPIRRQRVAERQKVVVHAVADQMLRVGARLNDRDANAGLRRSFGNIDERRPRVEELRRRTSFRILEKADLYDVQQLARHDRHKLITRGSQWRMSFLETRSSQG